MLLNNDNKYPQNRHVNTLKNKTNTEQQNEWTLAAEDSFFKALQTDLK